MGRTHPRVGQAAHKMTVPNQGAAANGLQAIRSRIAEIRERTVRSTATPEAVAELGR